MSEKSRWYWGQMCDAQVATRIERAAETLLNGFHHRVNPLVGWMRLDAADGPVDLERADDYLLKMDEVLNYLKTCVEELERLNFDSQPQINAVIRHMQGIGINGVFDAMELLKRECMNAPEAVFSSESSTKVSTLLMNKVDYMDIASGEPAPLRIQLEELKNSLNAR